MTAEQKRQLKNRYMELVFLTKIRDGNYSKLRDNQNALKGFKIALEAMEIDIKELE